MAQQLTDMSIDEISLVDDPANEQARVVIVKAKGGKKAAPKEDIEPMDDDEEDEEDADAVQLMARVKKAIDGLAPRVAQTLAGIPSADTDAADTAAASLKEFVMDIETLSKSLEDAEVKLAALAKRADDAENALTDASEVIKAKEAEIDALTNAAPHGEDTPAQDDEVLKSLPEAIRKRLQDSEAKANAAEAEIAKMRDAADLATAIAKAKELNVGDPAVVGPLLMRVGKGQTTADDVVVMERLLKGVSAVADESALFKSIGSDASGDSEPEDVLKSKAADILKANSGMTFEQAYAKAMDENPALYSAYVSKSKRRAP